MAGAPVSEPEPPRFPDSHLTRRVFVDDSTDRAAYFSGGESIGASITALAADGGQVSSPAYTILPLPAGEGHDWAYFTAGETTGAVTISDIGAEDASGLEAGLYSFAVQVEDGNGLTAQVLVSVQVVVSVLSTNGDGRP